MDLKDVNASIISEKHQARKEKEDKKMMLSKLFDYFYNAFKNKPHDFESLYLQLQYINEREKILNKLCQNDSLTFQYLNSIYNKTLKEVYTIYKNNYKFIEEQEKQEEMQILKEDLQKVLSIKQEQEKQEKENKTKIEQDRKKKEIQNILYFIFKIIFSFPFIIIVFFISLFLSTY